MSATRRVQGDLFEPVAGRAPLHPLVRAKLEPLLRSLLTEAVYRQPGTTAASLDKREDGDDQNHA
jgi:hypothetical protein